jgi:hypothetical protein
MPKKQKINLEKVLAVNEHSLPEMRESHSASRDKASELR